MHWPRHEFVVTIGPGVTRKSNLMRNASPKPCNTDFYGESTYQDYLP